MIQNPRVTEALVLAVLAGTPLDQAAAQSRVSCADLADAIEVYKAAGRAALEAQTSPRDWYQVRIQFTDWNSAERTAAAHLGPSCGKPRKPGRSRSGGSSASIPAGGCAAARARRSPGQT